MSLIRSSSRFLAASRVLANSIVGSQTRTFALATQRLAADLKFSEKHEWIRVNGSVGTVGITDYAQDKLGEVVYIELPEVGAKFAQSAQFSTLESVKAVSECYLPVGGKVVEVNEALKENPSNINKSPLDEGWLVRVELDSATKDQELGKLMTEAQYKEFLKSDHH